MSYPYPPQISALIRASEPVGVIEPNAVGRAASFLCGISITFELEIETTQGSIKNISFSTNGCGYVISAARVLSETLRGSRLVDLSALNSLDDAIVERLGEIPGERRHCINVCLDAVQKALANFRSRRIDEWSGEEALICSCFGVSENRIEHLVEDRGLETVEEVGGACKAGTGCGSCQQLIQEILDNVR